MTEHDEAVAAAIDGELALLDPGVRSSRQRVDALLHPDFREFGASGRVWDRASIMAMLDETDPGEPPTAVSGMTGVRLAPDLVHLTFDTDAGGRRAHRSSLWRRTREGWRLYFHQGTLFGAGD
ncbi:DUF4440 domain-containing protein [Streptomyces sp. DH24]|uniref:nuclear transport factor 2 family protein n=1 Tax=Streptomyces sp. DH24 TaxID=3040123 RepID=UPI00244371BD|nr:DUF4440 domain-containing protein [Streptomyces sp. DH24]MDG9717822.1 DUF4440 domain-containing protein [Streptomyces sp. DH24]